MNTRIAKTRGAWRLSNFHKNVGNPTPSTILAEVIRIYPMWNLDFLTSRTLKTQSEIVMSPENPESNITKFDFHNWEFKPIYPTHRAGTVSFRRLFLPENTCVVACPTGLILLTSIPRPAVQLSLLVLIICNGKLATSSLSQGHFTSTGKTE